MNKKCEKRKNKRRELKNIKPKKKKNKIENRKWEKINFALIYRDC